jgi:hypothetical protein
MEGKGFVVEPEDWDSRIFQTTYMIFQKTIIFIFIAVRTPDDYGAVTENWDMLHCCYVTHKALLSIISNPGFKTFIVAVLHMWVNSHLCQTHQYCVIQLRHSCLFCDPTQMAAIPLSTFLLHITLNLSDWVSSPVFLWRTAHHLELFSTYRSVILVVPLLKRFAERYSWSLVQSRYSLLFTAKFLVMTSTGLF